MKTYVSTQNRKHTIIAWCTSAFRVDTEIKVGDRPCDKQWGKNRRSIFWWDQ